MFLVTLFYVRYGLLSSVISGVTSGVVSGVVSGIRNTCATYAQYRVYVGEYCEYGVAKGHARPESRLLIRSPRVFISWIIPCSEEVAYEISRFPSPPPSTKNTEPGTNDTPKAWASL